MCHDAVHEPVRAALNRLADLPEHHCERIARPACPCRYPGSNQCEKRIRCFDVETEGLGSFIQRRSALNQLAQFVGFRSSKSYRLLGLIIRQNAI